MKNFNLKKIVLRIREQQHLVLLLISILSILFLYLKLYNINNVIWISQNLFLHYIFQLFIELSSIFTILFLPTYPIFFILLNERTFKLREKIGICIVTNLSFYILIGFIGSYLNLLITFEYFLNLLIISYVLILFITLIQNIYSKNFFFLKKTKENNYYRTFNSNFSLITHIKKKISFNGFLLTIFIILLCILNIVNSRFFTGTDAWLHISIVKYITEINYIPMNEYYGTLGLHIFGTVIHFFSGVDLILLPKFYLFYTIPLSALIIYNFLRRIFKNNNLAIFGVFLLFSSFGFTFFMMSQFWPSGIALIQGLVLFFILYVRMESLIKEKIPNKRKILSNILLLYPLLTIIFVSSFITHSLITIILLISYLWVYLIYFVRNYRRGIDFLLLIFFFGIFFVFYNLNISVAYFQIFNPFNILPWYFILFGVLAVGFLIFYFVFYYRKSLEFTKGSFKLVIKGKKKKFLKKIEDKYIFPIIFGITIILTSIFTVLALNFLNINILYIFLFSDILIIALFGKWGMRTFRYKRKAKPLFLWGIAIDFLFLVIFLLDVVIAITTFFIRVLYIALIMVIIEFVSYIYILIRNKSFQKTKYKIFLISIVCFSIFCSHAVNTVSRDIFFLKEQEVKSIEWYSNYTSEEKVIISKFGWYAIFIFFDYPFEDKNKTLELEAIHYFLTLENRYIHPSMHISNETNILKDLKSSFGREVIIILPQNFYLPFNWQFFDDLTEEEIETYYNLNYLNKICSVKNLNGEETPYYWVI